MQILVRFVAGETHAITVQEHDSGLCVKQMIQALTGVPAAAQRLSYGGRPLPDTATLAAHGVVPGALLHQLLHLRGGAPVKVQLLEPVPRGVSEVVVDLESDTPLLEVKRQLAAATGVPPQDQVLLLAAINQLVMGTKSGSLGYTHCGTASNLHFVVKAAQPK